MAGASRMDNIRAIYGAEVARELSVLELSEGPEPGPGLGPEDGVAFRVQVGDIAEACKGSNMNSCV